LLLNLPPELRNRIYELVLIGDDLVEVGTDVVVRRYAEGEESRAVIKEPPLLRTCHTIRNDATQLYYSSNKFTTDNIHKLINWIRGLTAGKRAMLKDIRTPRRPRPGPQDHMNLPFLLLDIEWWEFVFSRYKCVLGKDILRVYTGTNGPWSAFNKSEIEASMDARQWKTYRSYYRDLEKVGVFVTVAGEIERGVLR
jgi:hypothetical protein